MRARLLWIVVAALMMGAWAVPARAQADAAAAFSRGKTAYETGDFPAAATLFDQAARTDANNPETWLWLGRARYQLGAVDEAIVAWRKAVELAPKEPYATRMLEALRTAQADTATWVSLVESMLEQGLFEAADDVAVRTLAEKSTTPTQQARLWAARAEAQLELGKVKQSLATAQDVLVRYPQTADTDRVKLIQARGWLRMPQRADEGLAALAALGNAGGKQAASAQFERLAFVLDQRPSAANIDALSKWLAANPGNRSATAARTQLVHGLVRLATMNVSNPDEALRLATGAVSVAAELYPRLVRADESAALTKTLLDLAARLGSNRHPPENVLAVIEQMLKAPLPAADREKAMLALASERQAMVLRELEQRGQSGELASADPSKLPEALASVTALYATIHEQFPQGDSWQQQAALAESVRTLDVVVPPGKIKPNLVWAVQIALPVVHRGPIGGALSDIATNTIGAGIAELAKTPGAGRDMALAMNRQLIAATPKDNPGRFTALWRQVDLLDAAASAEFQEQRRLGNVAPAVPLSALQIELVQTLTRIVDQRADLAPQAIQRLESHLGPYAQAGLSTLTNDAMQRLAAGLGPQARRQVELSRVNLLIQQVIADDAERLGAGLAPARKLDPLLERAALRCYELHAGLDQDDPFLDLVRSAWGRIISHYQSLDFPEVAEAAAAVKADPLIPLAERFAQFQRAALNEQKVRAELADRSRQFHGSKAMERSDAERKLTAEYSRFIAEHPGDPLAMQAVERIFSVAQLYERLDGHGAAASVYQDFAAFAVKTPSLTVAISGAASARDRGLFAGAGALESKARAEMEQSRRTVPDDAPPPAKISDAYAAAVDAYRSFIADHSDSPLVAQAITRTLAIAMQYAQLGAWDVADGVYQVLLDAKLGLRYPERLQFSRGMCQVGKVLPDHARQVLAALSLIGQPGSPAEPTPATRPWRSGGGGMGAGGIGGIFRPAPKPVVGPSSSGESPDREGLRSRADLQALAAIQEAHSRRAGQIAELRDRISPNSSSARPSSQSMLNLSAHNEMDALEGREMALPVLSEAELSRRQGAIDAAYEIFQTLRTAHPDSITAEQARGEALLLADSWRQVQRWGRAASLVKRFITDNPADQQLPELRLAIAQDALALAQQPIADAAPDGKAPSTEQALATVLSRFDQARAELSRWVEDFPGRIDLARQARWSIATSFLTQARVVNAISPTLARGQYARAADELLRLVGQASDPAQAGNIPAALWSIAEELTQRGYYEQAIGVWSDLAIAYPTHPLARQSRQRMAMTYQGPMGRPLRAVETWLEINFAQGGNDSSAQDAVFAIGSELRQQKRWVEAQHVLQTFVDSFPSNANAAQALTMIGQIHQSNEAWGEAIAAYQRVISEFAAGQWAQEARWSIAECTINLSAWRDAIGLYEKYIESYPKEARVPEAARRIGVLKDLARYQALVDENGPKAFDAQFQMGSIVQQQLSNPAKAIMEYRKVAERWPRSHLADDALYAVGTTYLSMGDNDDARAALLQVAGRYPDSPLADDALLAVGRGYEDEARRLEGLTREKQFGFNKDVAQREAYSRLNDNRKAQRAEQQQQLQELRQSGAKGKAELAESRFANGNFAWEQANVSLEAQRAQQDVEQLTAAQLADRQDKVHAALRKAIEAYAKAAKVPGADKAGDALLRIAMINAEQLNDPQAAMATWLEIVRQFSGTAVAEEASWRIAQNYEQAGDFAQAIEAYKAFLRNYRPSPRASDAQFRIAENHEHLGQWVAAMDQYSNYLTNFPDGPLAGKAREQINWIKTYRL